jgi:hypothetical protein
MECRYRTSRQNFDVETDELSVDDIINTIKRTGFEAEAL